MENVNKSICDYISTNWIKIAKSNRAFALDHNIDEKTVRRILDDKNYAMRLETLNKICESRDINLSDFFMGVEEWNKSKKI